MSGAAIVEVLKRSPVLPVAVIESDADAVPLARALVAGGIDVIEITLRTEAAWAALDAVVAEVPEIVAGVGTAIHPEQVERASRAGARFVVSPGSTSPLLCAAAAVDVPFLPGVSTITEAMIAAESGFRHLKLFPAVPVGGVALLKAIAGPLPELRFCPTGGVNSSNAAAFLALPNVMCVGGSWITPRSLVASKAWNQITELARAARALRSTAC
jgi:2-dehydro-3-deoxyphosphogluconate aldolase/(4S)-4-hydroxy-2-oxoglutarate aldolase